MSRVLVTGSTTGLGLGVAVALLDGGHEVLLHARDRDRADTLVAAGGRSMGVVIGDLADPSQVTALAGQIERHGPLDAVIHNAGIYSTATRSPNAADQPAILAVNVCAPYLLTALLDRPKRLIYLSSGMHTSGRRGLDDLRWQQRRWDATQAYCDSKLFVTALSFALARRWPDVSVNAVDPGWVPTRMGGPGAPDDLVLGQRTQAWLAVSDDPEATTTGRYWYHQRPRPAAAPATDPAFQTELLDRLAELTGTELR